LLIKFTTNLHPYDPIRHDITRHDRGRNKLHCMPIEELWFRVDIQKVYMSNHPLMHPNEITNQMILGDVVEPLHYGIISI
jgi:hypothetical protein